MHLCRGCDQADTLVFSKPKLGGAWYLLYFLDPNYFWEAAGGIAILFDWVWDGGPLGFGAIYPRL